MRARILASTLSAALVTVLVAGVGAPATAAPNATPISMSITSSTHSRANITWYSDGNTALLANRKAPWTKSVSTAGYIHSITASNATGDVVSLTCTIRYKSRVVKKRTVTGAYVRVSCDYQR